MACANAVVCHVAAILHAEFEMLLFDVKVGKLAIDLVLVHFAGVTGDDLKLLQVLRQFIVEVCNEI